MRIVAGAWRGRRLHAPAGQATRPTSDRARQALFDALAHAAWGGRAVIEGATVLDGFAGTGALGLEALSRGAARAWFIERDRAALDSLRRNVAACDGGSRCVVHAADVLRPPRGAPCRLAFLDPPYGGNLIVPAIHALRGAGWIGDGSLVLAELGRGDPLPGPDQAGGPCLHDRPHGAARLVVWRIGREACNDSTTPSG